MKIDDKIVLENLKKRNISILDSIENYRTKKNFQCSNLHIWTCTAYDIIERQHSCPQCGLETHLDNLLIDQKVNDLNAIRKLENGMRKREAIIRVGDYINHQTKIEWQCLVDKHHWLSTPHDILFRGVGCPLCHVKSETLIYLTLCDKLISLGITAEVVRQKELTTYVYENKTCKAYGDFWFEINNQIYLIEYNGAQHYELVFFGSTTTQSQAEAKLKKQQFRDLVVQNFAVNNKIKLIVIDGRKVNGEKKVKLYLEKLFQDLI